MSDIRSIQLLQNWQRPSQLCWSGIVQSAREKPQSRSTIQVGLKSLGINVVERVSKVFWNLWIALISDAHLVLQIMNKDDELHILTLYFVRFIHNDLTETNKKEFLKYCVIQPSNQLEIRLNKQSKSVNFWPYCEWKSQWTSFGQGTLSVSLCQWTTPCLYSDQ